MGRITSIFSMLSVALLPVVAQAGDAFSYLGTGQLLVNDAIGDQKDRWRSGSYVASLIYGSEWQGHLPQTAGEIVEFRLFAEVMAPDNLVTPAAGDRPYAGTLSFGAHTQFQRGGNEMSLGADLVMIGPQTGLSSLHSRFHEAFGMDGLSPAVDAGQIVNQFRPTASFEVGHPMTVWQGGELRPFVEMRAGAETFARVGFDLRLGSVGAGDLMVRDSVTGLRYRALRESRKGTSFVIGADMAKVIDSVYLPESQGYTLTDTRDRVRAGVHWQGEKHSLFYGVTWLGEEFVGQGDGQMVGAINLNFQF